MKRISVIDRSKGRVNFLMSTTTTSTITIRIIKSFQYKNIVNVVLHNIDLESSLCSLTALIRLQIKDNPRLQNFPFDSFKVYSRPFQAKTCNFVINCSTAEEDTMLIFPTDATCSLLQAGFEDQCEVSLFSLQEYKAYCSDPQMRW